MKEFSDEYDICPHCGYYIKALPDVINHLYPGTVLAGRYIIGVVVGHGGFGVVYKAWDKQLDHMVCIKEYFPIEFANRTPGKTEIIVYSGQRKEGFYLGLVPKALDDENFGKLNAAIGAHDLDAAFAAAHGLKGMLGNLALTPLYEPVNEMTELLRSRTETDYAPYLQKINEKKEELNRMVSEK